MQESVEQFLKFLADDKDFSENTLAAYNNDLTQFRQFLQGETVSDLEEGLSGDGEPENLGGEARHSRGKHHRPAKLASLDETPSDNTIAINGQVHSTEADKAAVAAGNLPHETLVHDWSQVNKDHILSYMTFL